MKRNIGKKIGYWCVEKSANAVATLGVAIGAGTYLTEIVKEDVSNLNPLEKIAGKFFHGWLPVSEQIALSMSEIEESTLQDSYVLSAGLIAAGLGISMVYGNARRKL